MEEHVPNPSPWEDWTAQDHAKFRVFSGFCPMCKYKYEHGVLSNLVTTGQGADENTQAAMLPIIAQKQNELIQLGLFIATAVDDANKEAGQAEHN